MIRHASVTELRLTSSSAAPPQRSRTSERTVARRVPLQRVLGTPRAKIPASAGIPGNDRRLRSVVHAVPVHWPIVIRCPSGVATENSLIPQGLSEIVDRIVIPCRFVSS